MSPIWVFRYGSLILNPRLRRSPLSQSQLPTQAAHLRIRRCAWAWPHAAGSPGEALASGRRAPHPLQPGRAPPTSDFVLISRLACRGQLRLEGALPLIC